MLRSRDALNPSDTPGGLSLIPPRGMVEPMTTTAISVRGMTCGHCVAAVRAEVGALEGVSDVSVDLASGAVTITSLADLDPAAVAAAVDEAGYEVVP